MTEEELNQALDAAGDQVLQCAQGAITLDEFLVCYRDFFDAYALDGHESSTSEREILAKHRAQIELHRRVRDEILYRITSEEYASNPEYVRRGFIGPAEAKTRLGQLAAEYLGSHETCGQRP